MEKNNFPIISSVDLRITVGSEMFRLNNVWTRQKPLLKIKKNNVWTKKKFRLFWSIFFFQFFSCPEKGWKKCFSIKINDWCFAM